MSKFTIDGTPPQGGCITPGVQLIIDYCEQMDDYALEHSTTVSLALNRGMLYVTHLSNHPALRDYWSTEGIRNAKLWGNKKTIAAWKKEHGHE